MSMEKTDQRTFATAFQERFESFKIRYEEKEAKKKKDN